MKILLTGSTGYIAQRLLPFLLNNGHEVICCVRDRARFNSDMYLSPSLSILEVDFLKTMNYVFYRVTLPGVAAIVLLLISLFLMEGSLSFNSFLGLSDNYDESIVCLLTGN